MSVTALTSHLPMDTLGPRLLQVLMEQISQLIVIQDIAHLNQMERSIVPLMEILPTGHHVIVSIKYLNILFL